MKRRNQIFILFLFISVAFCANSAFVLDANRRLPTHRKATTTETTTHKERRNCVYRSPVTNKWTPRIELSELTVGQMLEGAVIVQEKLDGRTGPKVWVDCGVGRSKPSSSNHHHHKWKIQTAMLRLGGPNMKVSVAAKKAARLRKKQPFTVHVSRIRLDNDQLEVTLMEPEPPKQHQPRRIRTSSLTVGQELTGIIQRVEDYGVLMDIGASRPGLLHIRRVGDLYQKFIHQSVGLQKVGLTKGVQVQVQVLQCDSKRLFLDFSESLKRDAELKYSKVEEEGTTADPYAEEAALFAAQQQQQEPSLLLVDDDVQEEEEEEEDYDDDEEEEEDDDDDDYDEDRDIEDAMGLGRY